MSEKEIRVLAERRGMAQPYFHSDVTAGGQHRYPTIMAGDSDEAP